MRSPVLLVLLLALPAAGPAPSARWDVTSTIVDMTIPGAPGFLLRMAKGKSRAEHKCVAPEPTTAALLAPDPKARCRIDRQQIADGRYAQALTCPQKNGNSIHVERAGSYDASGFTGTAEATGQTPKGAMRIAMTQRAVRKAGKCGG